MDATRVMAVVEELESKDTKRRLQGLDTLVEGLRRATPHPDSWQQAVPPLVRTLRDNNFKVCRGSLACLELLVGHDEDGGILPFLSMITPAVVECLGNSKVAVQEKGVDLLVALTNPSVQGARDTIASLVDAKHFHHKNWRVRESLVRYVGRAVDVDGAGVLEWERSATARGGLAQLLADALGDLASQVRREALVAAGCVRALMGDSLLAQLEINGVRNAQLLALRDRSTGGGSGGNRSPGNVGDDENNPSVGNVPSVTSHGEGDEYPPAAAVAATPVPSSRTAILARSSGGGGGGGGSSGRAAAAHIRTRAGAPTGSVLTRGRGGGGAREASGVSFPAAAVAGVGSPAWLSFAGGGSGGGGGGGEESAFSALDPLVPVNVYTERDVRREVEAAKAGLEHGSDWQRWVTSMQRLAGVALGGAATEFPTVLVGLVRASVHEMIGHKVSENRSAVAREACRCVAVLAACLTDHFGDLAELWLPEVIKNTTRSVVVATAADEAARTIFGCTRDGFPRLLPFLMDTARSKSPAIRRRCVDYAMLALALWGDSAFERYLPQTRDMIAAAVSDADSSVRATARRAFLVFRRRFRALAQSVMDSLSPSSQRHILREEQEFDVEAFVKTATATTETPQEATGTTDVHGKRCHYSPSTATATSTSTALPPTSSPRGPTELAQKHPDERDAGGADGGGCAAGGSSSSAARRTHGTHNGSSPSSSSGAAGDSPSVGAVRCARVKVDRGARGVVRGPAATAAAAVPPAVVLRGDGLGGVGPARRTHGRLPSTSPFAGAEAAVAGTPEARRGVDSPFESSGDRGGATLRVPAGGGVALRVPAGGGSGRGGGAAVGCNDTFAGGGGGGGGGLKKSPPRALRVPRGRHHHGNGETLSSSSSLRQQQQSSGANLDPGNHQRVTRAVEGAQRVVARRMPATTTTATAAGGGGVADSEQRAEREGVPGGVSLRVAVRAAGRVVVRQKSEGGAAAGAVVEREGVGEQQLQQQQRLDAAGAAGGTGEGGRSAEGAAVTSRALPVAAVVPVALDRRVVLRQVDELLEQAGVSHWAARVEALEGLLELLIVAGGDGFAGEGKGEGGRFVLESRATSRRLEAVMAERVKDAHFRVAAAALNLLGRLVEVHSALMEGHASVLLPSVFPNLADAKEPVRQAASRVLDTCRAAYSPYRLCAVLCPRVLELAPGRARTGLLEFLIVLVPHSASFLGNPGHLHSLTQRVAVALVQSPPPTNWDGGSGGGGLGEEKGGGGSSALVAAASAATRLLTALFRLDGDALLTASASLPPDSLAAVRRALGRFCAPDAVGSPGIVALPPSAGSQQQQKKQQQQRSKIVEVAATVAGGVYGANVGDDYSGGDSSAEGAAQVSVDEVGAMVLSPPSVRAATVAGVGSGGKSSSVPPAGHVAGKERSSDSPETVDTAPISSLATGTSGSLSAFCLTGGVGEFSRLPSPPQQLQHEEEQHARMKSPHREPLAPVTPRVNSGVVSCYAVDGQALTADFGCENIGSSSRNACPASAPGGGGDEIAAAKQTARSRSWTPTTQAGGESTEVARRLIAGLSPGARTSQKVDAFSSLRGLAEGEGAGAGPDFWPRYFGQVLMLLLEGASSSTTASPSRRRVVLRAKYVQGVRCLVARRGTLFPESTEVVVGRLVEIGGGDPSPIVWSEVEACLADLASVLEPSRYLTVLVPLLLSSVADNDNDGDLAAAQAEGGEGSSWRNGGGGSGGRAAAEWSGPALTQCVALEALRVVTSRLSSPALLAALGAGPLLAGLAGAMESRDLLARKRAVMALVEMYQVLEEALLPFLSGFPTTRLKLITMYIEQRRARDRQDRAAKAADSAYEHKKGVEGGVIAVGAGVRGRVASPVVFAPIR